MQDYKISELISLGKTAERVFEGKLGYTSASFHEMSLDSNNYHRLYFHLEDDFQNELPYDRRFKCGSMTIVRLENFWTTLEQWPNREQRELEIMAQKFAAIDANLDQIRSAQVRAFVARLQPEIDEIRRMLTHQPKETVTPPEGWPEESIPF